MQLLTDVFKPGTSYFRNHQFTPDQVCRGVDTVAQYLSANIVSESPFVYLVASNHIKAVFAFFGIIKASRICVIIDPEIGMLELNEKILDVPPAAIVRIDIDTFEWECSKEFEFFSDTAGKDIKTEELDDVCVILFSSANDGYAKAVMLTNKSLIQDSFAALEAADINANSVIAPFLLFSHLYGIQVGMILPNLVGAKYLIEEKTNLTSVHFLLNKMTLYGVTHIMSIPVLYYMLCKCDVSIVRCLNLINAISGGYKLSDSIAVAFLRKFDLPICEGYGLTEAGPSCTFNSVKNGIKCGSIGRPLPCCQIKIVDEGGNLLQRGLAGEIVVNGTNVMRGYYLNPLESANTLRNGWLFTGDVGYQDGDGFIFYVGTKKRMINYGGQKVYPVETERLLLKNENVKSASIVATDNDLLGQVFHAEIELFENSETCRSNLKKWMKTNITSYKIPRKMIVNNQVTLI